MEEHFKTPTDPVTDKAPVCEMFKKPSVRDVLGPLIGKLKTLKDLDYPEDPSLWDEKRLKEYKKQEEDDIYDSIVKVCDLKQEAIKWYHRSDGNKHRFIIEFFNIKEEDLKCCELKIETIFGLTMEDILKMRKYFKENLIKIEDLK